MKEKILAAVAAALVGTLFNWVGIALTLQGRVTAVEAGQARMEQQLITIIGAVKAKP